jgi:predicted acetyltransferase
MDKQKGAEFATSLRLVTPSIEYEEGYREALEEQRREKDPNDTILESPQEGETFEHYVHGLVDMANGINLPEGYVPATILFIVDNGRFIGRVSIRHELNDYLEKYGGHIGDWIRPSERGKGYGKLAFKLSLDKAKELGISRVLLTVNDDNIPSIKRIEANGGVMENIVTLEENGHTYRKRRYWITQ